MTDTAVETPLFDLVASALDAMRRGGAMRVMDIPGDSSYSASKFGGEVSKEIARRADLAAVPAQVREHEQDLIIRDLTMMLIRASRHVPDDQMAGVFDYMRRKGIDHGPLRSAALEPQPDPRDAVIALAITACRIIDDAVKEGYDTVNGLMMHLLEAVEPARAALEPLPTILHIGWGQALSQVYKPQPDPRTADYEQAYQYALTLADALIAKHYPDNKDWRPLGDLTGLLTQIDNMVADKMPDPRDEVIARLLEALENPSGHYDGTCGCMSCRETDAALAAAKSVQHG